MAGVSSEVRLLTPQIMCNNSMNHHFPYPLKPHMKNFQPKPSSTTNNNPCFESCNNNNNGLRVLVKPCLAAEMVDEMSNNNPERDDVVVSTSEQTKSSRKRVVKVAWEKLVRWSRSLRSKNNTHHHVLQTTKKVVVLGGGSFGTAMAAHVADRKPEMEVSMLLRDIQLCQSINQLHCNSKYFPNHKLPLNLTATTSPKLALQAADFCLHAVPVQFSASYLESIVDYVDPGLPFISLSKGLELNTLRMMSQIIPQALRNPRQRFVALSGPSFALELMNKLPTAMVVASRDKKLANEVQQLLASDRLRISTSK